MKLSARDSAPPTGRTGKKRARPEGRGAGCVGKGGEPNGVEPEPKAPEGVKAKSHDGEPSREAFDRLNALIEQESFRGQLLSCPLDQAAQGHRDVEKHHLGKLALRIHRARRLRL